jgi:DNA-binding NarL/FixJ family response regulator
MVAAAEISTARKLKPKPLALPPRPLRVLISASPSTRNVIESLLERDPSLQVKCPVAPSSQLRDLVAESDPDVLLLHLESQSALVSSLHNLTALAVPIVLLADHIDVGVAGEAIVAGIRGLLTGDPSGQELAAALHAAAAGLLTLSSDLAAIAQQGLNEHSQDGMEAAESNPLPEHLTQREREVLEMMMEGLSNKQIAAELQISAHTVKFHISSILGKLGASTRTEATAIGLRRGLITI